jgi:hypothetical protein
MEVSGLPIDRRRCLEAVRTTLQRGTWQQSADELYDFFLTVGKKRRERTAHKFVRGLRRQLQDEWARKQELRVQLPDKNGAGTLTVGVRPGLFTTDISITYAGRYSSACSYSIRNHYLSISMPRTWEILPTGNMALPYRNAVGRACRLVKRRGYRLDWEKGYYFHGQFFPVEEWSPEGERRILKKATIKRLDQ